MVVAIGQLRPMTIDDLEAFPDDGSRREILRGELIVTPAPTPVHQLLVTRLVALLSNFANSTNAGFVLTAPIDVQLTRYDVVQPDVVFVARAREALLRGAFIEGAPDLVVEVLSPSTRRIDLVRKMALYGTSGIREYWIVDFENRSVRVVSFRDGTPVDVIRTTGKVESQVLVGVDIDIADLFEGIPGLKKSAIL